MITTEQKDGILLELSTQGNKDWLEVNAEMFEMNRHTFGSLLNQFEKRGFIKIKSDGGKGGQGFVITIEIDLDDFLQRGGYKFEEEIFRNNFMKLELELAKLEVANPSVNFENATKLLGAVASGFDIYKHLND